MMMFLLLSLVLFSSVWNSLLFCDSGDSSTICSKIATKNFNLVTDSKKQESQKNRRDKFDIAFL
jgi:hypothetical protein